MPLPNALPLVLLLVVCWWFAGAFPGAFAGAFPGAFPWCNFPGAIFLILFIYLMPLPGSFLHAVRLGKKICITILVEPAPPRSNHPALRQD